MVLLPHYHTEANGFNCMEWHWRIYDLSFLADLSGRVLASCPAVNQQKDFEDGMIILLEIIFQREQAGDPCLLRVATVHVCPWQAISLQSLLSVKKYNPVRSAQWEVNLFSEGYGHDYYDACVPFHALSDSRPHIES